MDSDGYFVISWYSDDQDGSDFGVYAQRYDFTVVTGLIEQLRSSIQLYPNPVVDKLLLDVTTINRKDIHLVIINSQGKTLRERTYSAIVNDLIEVDFSRFNRGLYILRLSDGKRIFWGKVQKL